MKNLLKGLTIMVAVLYTAAAFAQAPAPAPTPAPVEQTTAPQTGLVPAEAPKAEVAAQPSSVLKLSPSLMVKPIGFDKDFDTWGYFVSLEPSLSFSSDFYSATKKTLGLSLGYTFIYQQYINIGQDKKFEHDFSFGLSHQVSPKVSIGVNTTFNYYNYYSSAHSDSNAYELNIIPMSTWKITDRFTAGIGYDLWLQVKPDVIRTYDMVDPITNPVTDPGDFFRGSALYTGSGGSYDPYAQTYFPPEGETLRNFWHAISGSLGYKIAPTTTASFKFKYFIDAISNNDAAEFYGSELNLGIGHQLWKGGSINLEYRYRFRFFKYAWTEVTGSQKKDQRHRVIATFSQAINDYVSVESWFRLNHMRSNTDNPDTINEFYLGVNLSF